MAEGDNLTKTQSRPHSLALTQESMHMETDFRPTMTPERMHTERNVRLDMTHEGMHAPDVRISDIE